MAGLTPKYQASNYVIDALIIYYVRQRSLAFTTHHGSEYMSDIFLLNI